MSLQNYFVYVLDICQCLYLIKSTLFHPHTSFVYIYACLSSVTRARIIYDIVYDNVLSSESSDGKIDQLLGNSRSSRCLLQTYI